MSLASDPTLAPYIEEIDNSIMPVNIGNLTPAPPWLQNFGGGATQYVVGQGILIQLDLAFIQNYFAQCGTDLTVDLQQVLAHELGHAYDIIFNTAQAGTSIDFENALRSGMLRMSENIGCECHQ